MLQILNPFKAGKGFQKLKSKKKWILAFLIVLIPVVLSTVGNSLVQQKNQDLTQQFMEEGTQPPGGRGAPGGRPAGTQRTILGPFMRLFRGSTGPVGGTTETIVLGFALSVTLAVFFWVLKSVVFHVAAKVLGGEEVTISSAIHVIAYTYIPFVFKGILDVFAGLIYEAPSSIEELLYQFRSTDVLLDFVRDHFNIFVLWALFLMVIAVREQYNLGNKKAAVVVLIPYLVAWVIQIAVISSGGLFMGGM